MVRLLAFLVGLFFSGMLLLGLGDTIIGAIKEPAQATAEHEFHENPLAEKFPHDGPLGKYNRGQLQRGLKVYQEVCAACHSMNLVSFRNLSEKGGPGFTPDEVKALAASYTVKDGPGADGEMFDRAMAHGVQNAALNVNADAKARIINMADGDGRRLLNLVEQLGEYDPKLDLSQYQHPTLDLLENYTSSRSQLSRDELMVELEANKKRIIETLGHYAIEIDKIKATVGPTVTLFEIVPKAGIRILYQSTLAKIYFSWPQKLKQESFRFF